MPRFPFSPRRRASALVTTLLVVALMSIIVVAFLQSMTIENRTARSFSELTRSQLAVEAAHVEATTRLARLMAANPYHAIGYTNIVDAGKTNLVTVLFGAPSAAAATNAAGAPRNHYLYSVTNDLIPATGLDPSNSTALNRTNADPSGWMGSPVTTSGSTTYRECRAPWVYLLQNPSLPHQPDKSLANYNPYVARYAWWVEDETSKIDVLQAGNADGSSGAYLPPQGTNLVTATNVAFQDAQFTRPGLMDLGAIPILDGLPLSTAPAAATTNHALISYRTNLLALPRDGRALARSVLGTNSEAKARYYITYASIANDLNSSAQPRVNLNALVANTSDPVQITGQLDDIAYVISGSHISTFTNSTSGFFHTQANVSTSPLAAFGDRFWPATDNVVVSGVGLSQKRAIYLTKLAANIRDYIDSDNLPTFVDKNGAVFSGTDPGGATGGIPPVGTFPSTPDSRSAYPLPMAIGHEAIPYLIKSAYSFGSTSSAIYFDQYFSFFNPSTKRFVAPPGTFFRCYNRMSWSGFGIGNKPMKPFELDLSNLVIEPGQVKVITTSPSSATDAKGAGQTGNYSASDYGATVNPANLFRAPIKQVPSGGFAPGSPEAQEGTRIITSGVAFSSTTQYIPVSSSGGAHDYQTTFMWGNTNGYYGGFSAVTATYTGTYKMTAPNQFKDGGATTMRGNDAISHSGDARSIQEPLVIDDIYSSGATGGDQDQYRFYSDSATTQLDSPYNKYIVPPGDALKQPWPDYTRPFDATVNTAYGVVRDEPMTSIGELGHIYDPYRRNGSGNVDYARGGGRTLRIGQPDDVIVNGNGLPGDFTAAVNAARFTPAWANGAWHLTDIFEAVLNTTSGTQTANTNTLLAPVRSAGKININSVMRDDGAVLSAFLRNFKFLSTSPATDINLVNKVLSTNELSGANGLIPQIKAYIAAKGPFMERGELSQLSFFGIGTGTSGTFPMSSSLDRAREEVFRRILPMLTTRSSSFSVYAIGQAVREDKNGNIIPLAEASKGSVYRIDPQIGSGIRDAATNYQAGPLYERF